MMESSKEKKNLFYIIVLLLTLIVMIIGTTIAYFSLISSQKEEGTTLYTGTLAISYIDGTYINNPELMPIKNVNYNTYENVYRNNFSVASYGTLDQTLAIDLEITNNEFLPNAIKYAIFNEKGTELSRGYVPNNGTINLASNMFLASEETIKYTLIIWLDNTNYNQNLEMGKTITGQITVYAKQIKY